MIYYRLLGRHRKQRWKKIDGATTLRDGVAYVEQIMPELRSQRDVVTWEVGCTLPPRDTPQAKRSGPIV